MQGLLAAPSTLHIRRVLIRHLSYKGPPVASPAASASCCGGLTAVVLREVRKLSCNRFTTEKMKGPSLPAPLSLNAASLVFLSFILLDLGRSWNKKQYISWKTRTYKLNHLFLQKPGRATTGTGIKNHLNRLYDGSSCQGSSMLPKPNTNTNAILEPSTKLAGRLSARNPTVLRPFV